MIKLKDIKTPTTVEEFKENLKKYYFGYGKDALYVKPENENENADGIGYDKISSFSDIYKITKSGFGGDGTSPYILPMITQESFDLMCKTTVKNRFDKTVTNEELFKIIGDIDVYEFSDDKRSDYFSTITDFGWSKLDNQVMREYFSKTLGKFSGYTPYPDGSWS